MAYKGIELESQQVDLMAGAQLNEEYLKINPQGTVPALVLDDGTVLTEVIGICTYLEALYPEKPLMGSTPLEKALVASWTHKLWNTVTLGVAEALRNTGPGFVNRALPGPLAIPQIPELAERGRMRLEYIWPVLNDELEGRQWLAGEHMTLADIDLLACCGFAGWVKCSPGEEFGNIHAIIARVRQAVSLN